MTCFAKTVPCVLLAWALSQTAAGCSGGDRDDDGGDRDAPQTIVVGITDQITDLDPAVTYESGTWELLQNISLRLYDFRPGSTELEPYLATGAPLISADGLEYTFQLRQGMLDADGTEITAQVLKDSLDRVRSLARPPAWLFTDFVTDVEVVDTYKMKFILAARSAYFLSLVATVPYTPVNPGLYPPDRGLASPFLDPATKDAAWTAANVDQTTVDLSHALGAGAYRITELSFDASLGEYGRFTHVELEANPDFTAREIKNDAVTLRLYGSAAELRAAVQSGEVDVAWREMLPQDYVEIINAGDLKIFEVGGGLIRYLCFRTNEPPFNNVNLRRAIAAAVDREPLYNQILQGSAMPLYSMVPRGMWGHTDAFKDTYGARDLAGAIQILQEAGYSAAQKLPMDLWYAPEHYGETEAAIASALETSIEETGLVEVTVQSREWNGFNQGTTEGAFAAFLLGWFPDYIDPDNYLRPFGHSSASPSMGIFYSDTEMDNLLTQAAENTDMTERTSTYASIQERWAEQVPTVPLVQRTLYLVTQQNITLTVPSPVMLLHYDTISRH